VISDYIHRVKIRGSILRRLTACVLALSFGLYTAEALLADTHDGDATHEELARADGAGQHAAFHIAHGDTPSVARGVAQSSAPDDHPGERAPGDSGHKQHACHCAHVHSGWLQTPPSSEAEIDVKRRQPISVGEQAPANRCNEPQLRPPIG
jgi:hypothetical protein